MTSFGFTSIASAQTITNTGPDSSNRIDTEVKNTCTIKNNNAVSVNNRNNQSARSGNATVEDNTGGCGWDGWAALDPAAAQANGLSYNSWRSGVTDWMAQHGTGNGWNGAGDNLSWAPPGNDWASYDPAAWQASGQSFGNWWNGAQSYLDTNSPVWLLGWPASANHDGSFGGSATSGNASNGNSTNFTIRINNAASAAAGTNACGQSLFIPPHAASNVISPRVSTPHVAGASIVVPGHQPSGGAGGFGGFGGGSLQPSVAHMASAPIAAVAPAHVAAPTVAVAAPSIPPVVIERAAISNTGPESVNKITSEVKNNISVANNNNICVTNTNNQTASTGNATVNDNTHADSSDTGNATNGNGTGASASLAN